MPQRHSQPQVSMAGLNTIAAKQSQTWSKFGVSNAITTQPNCQLALL